MIRWVPDRAGRQRSFRQWFLMHDGVVIGFMTAYAVYTTESVIVNGDESEDESVFAYWQASFGTTLVEDRTYPRLRDAREWREEIQRWVSASVTTGVDLSFEDEAFCREWENAPRSSGAIRRHNRRLKKEGALRDAARSKLPTRALDDDADSLPF